MGPGPSNAHPRVLAAQVLPLLGHMHPQFFKVCVLSGGWLVGGGRHAPHGRPVLNSSHCTSLPLTTYTLYHITNPIQSNPIHQIMDEIQQGLRYLFQTDSPYTLCVSGTGHAGMEVGGGGGEC
jgi:alanine-glyoxylate transaminase/serine-glyoxylate transaminase/serine-pyruvate transaminase